MPDFDRLPSRSVVRLSRMSWADKLGFGVTSQSQRIDGLRIHYVRGGKGHPVLLLHGYPETSFAWRKVIPRLASSSM